MKPKPTSPSVAPAVSRPLESWLRGLGMKIIAYDPALPDTHAAWKEIGAARVNFDELLAQADVVSLHVPLLDSTKNLFNAERIATMKPGAVLINTSRGGIIDDAALVAALKSGALGGAAIDVFTQEPLPASAVFSGCPNLILTPHIAGVTFEANVRVSSMIADAVIKALS